MTEYLDGAQPLPWVDLKERMNQVGGMLRELGRRLLWLSGGRLLRAILVLLLVGIRIVDVVFTVDDQMMQLLHA